MDSEYWIYEWREVLVRAGIDKVKAHAESLAAYGLNACRADLAECPHCAAVMWLKARSLIPAEVDRLRSTASSTAIKLHSVRRGTE